MLKSENRTLKTENCISNQQGFTLLEIMVVVFLIALTVGIVSVNFRHDVNQVIKQEARRFVALVGQMCQESIAQGRVLAITADGATAYKFVMYDAGEWKLMPRDDIFRQRLLAEDISLNLQLNNAPSSKEKPYLRCEPDGFMTPFTAEFELDDNAYRVTTNAMQEMEISAVQ